MTKWSKRYCKMCLSLLWQNQQAAELVGCLKYESWTTDIGRCGNQNPEPAYRYLQSEAWKLNFSCLLYVIEKSRLIPKISGCSWIPKLWSEYWYLHLKLTEFYIIRLLRKKTKSRSVPKFFGTHILIVLRPTSLLFTMWTEMTSLARLEAFRIIVQHVWYQVWMVSSVCLSVCVFVWFSPAIVLMPCYGLTFFLAKNGCWSVCYVPQMYQLAGGMWHVAYTESMWLVSERNKLNWIDEAAVTAAAAIANWQNQRTTIKWQIHKKVKKKRSYCTKRTNKQLSSTATGHNNSSAKAAEHWKLPPPCLSRRPCLSCLWAAKTFIDNMYTPTPHTS